MAQEPIEKYNLAEALILQGEQQLKEVVMNFGVQFAVNLRRRIETLSRQLQYSLTQKDDLLIEQYYANLQVELYKLHQVASQYFNEE